MTCAPHFTAEIAAALGSAAGVSLTSNATRWSMTLDGIEVLARLSPPWLVLSAPLPDEVTPVNLLVRNGLMPASTKYVLTADGALELRAERALDVDSPSPAGEVWNAFRQAHPVHRGAAAPPQAEAATEPPADLLPLAVETGWPLVQRDDGSIVVELECPNAFVQAVLGRSGDGYRVFVPLPTFDAAAADSAAAIATLLLMTGTQTCAVRAAAVMEAGQAAPCFETVFSTQPGPAQLAHSFASLSIAWAGCGEEIKALQNAEIARHFLALRRGLVSVPQPHPNQERKPT